jgi:hypothetical protein
MADGTDLTADTADLEKLAAELDAQEYAVTLVTGEGNSQCCM